MIWTFLNIMMILILILLMIVVENTAELEGLKVVWTDTWMLEGLPESESVIHIWENGKFRSLMELFIIYFLVRIYGLYLTPPWWDLTNPTWSTYSTKVLHPSLTCYILPIKCSIVLGWCFLHSFLLWPRMAVLYLDLIWCPVCCPLYWPIVGWLLQIFTSSFGTWVILVTHLSVTVLSGGIPSTSSLLSLLLLTAMKTFSSAISTLPPCHHNNIQLGAFCGCVTQWKDRQAAILLGTKSNLSLACFALLACQPFRVWDEPKLLWEYWLAPPLPNVNPPTIPPIPLSCVSPIPSSVRPPLPLSW